jgi:hypothetical protein
VSRLAPFCFYNGNTFVAILSIALQKVPGLSQAEFILLRRITAHIVAGTVRPEEEIQFRSLVHKLE